MLRRTRTLSQRAMQLDLMNSRVSCIFVLAILVSILVVLPSAETKGQQPKKPRDYYEVLGVKKDATEREIKKAYHRLSQKYHPDKNSAPDANDKFIEISNAYQILSDSEKRKQYDQFGFEGEAGGFPGGGGGGWQQAGGFPGGGGGGGNFNFEDPFKFFNEFHNVKFEFTGDGGAGGRRAGGGGGGFDFSNLFGGFGGGQGQRQQQRGRSGGAPLYSKSVHGITKLSAANFDKSVMQSDSHLWLIHFFDSNSPKCRELESVWFTVTKSLNEMVKIGVVDATSEGSLLKKLGVKSGSIVAFPVVASASKKRLPQVYKGERTAQEITDFAVDMMPSKAIVVNTLTWAKFVSSSTDSTAEQRLKVLLFTSKDSIPPLFKQLSYTFRDSPVDFGVVYENNKQALQKKFSASSSSSYSNLFSQVKSSPTLLAASPSSEAGEPTLNKMGVFSGRLKLAEMTSWVTSLLKKQQR